MGIVLKTINVLAVFVWATENRKLGVGPAGRLLDVQGYVWLKIRPAVVTADTCEVSQSRSRERLVHWPFAVEPDLAAVTLAVCVAAGSGGRYVGRFVVEADPAAGTLMAPSRVEKGGRHKRQISERSQHS